MVIQGLDHLALVVRDVARSAAWYRDVFGLEPRFDGLDEQEGCARAVFVGIGSTHLALYARGIVGPDAGAGVLPTAHHFAFRTDGANFERAQEILRERAIPFEMQHHAVCRSLYLRDPDGYQVEITTYETVPDGDTL